MKVLIVDDERNIREIILKLLELEGIRGKIAENGLAAQRLLEQEEFDLLVSDLKMPGLDGLELLSWIKEKNYTLPVIMISAFGQASDAVNALRLGAFDYIVKPFDPDILIHRIKNGLKIVELSQNSLNDEPEYLAFSPAMRQVKQKIKKVAPKPSTILITGESGSGKEVTARYIHNLSPFSQGPFLSINVGAIPENLLESELFGHEKGAFTGADRQKIGLIESATGGTLFLDEIGEMPLNMQVKMLRVLQERTIRRVGGVEEIPFNARILSATHRDLKEKIKEGTFREDLYYRLNVAPIALPALRERQEDIIPLAFLLLKNLNIKMGSSINKIDPKAIELLEHYTYPGNIRELENILEGACIYAEGTILQAHDLNLIPKEKNLIRQDKEGTLKNMEKQMILQTLLRWEGNKTQAAKELGITRRTIQNKIIEYGLDQKI